MFFKKRRSWILSFFLFFSSFFLFFFLPYLPGTSTRKNGSNRGKMQRWCVDCQKSYRVKDAYTALEIQQNAQRIEDEAKAQIRKEEEILRIQMQLDMEREEEEGKKFKSERCSAKCSL